MRFSAILCHFAASMCLVLCAPAALAQADGVISVYTDLNPDECTILNADDFGVSYACPGYKGYPLYVAEGDLRYFVSYGFGAPDEMAAGQTLPQFNTIHAKLEWRLHSNSGRFMPFATILRFFTQSGDENEPDGQILVVTKIEPGNTCHIAYVDAKLTENPNEVARDIADNQAQDFDCDKDEIYLVPS